MFLIYDLGGTNIRAAACIAPCGILVGKAVTETPVQQGDLAEAMLRVGDEVLAGAVPASIAIGFPGPISPDGRALAAPTMKCRVDLGSCKRVLQEHWGITPIHVLNDVTAAGYFYCSRGEKDFGVINVGSGIGLKIFLDGRPVVGPRGLGGELGHLVVDSRSDAPTCDCGERGHLGRVASGRGVLALARQSAAKNPDAFARSSLATGGRKASEIDNNSLAHAFADGDGWTRFLINEAAAYLGQAIASLHLSLGLERFYIVGGFAAALGEAYRALLVSAAARNCWDMGQQWDEMIILEQQDDVALLGGSFAICGAGLK